jgi:YidC/Oxa1 family membrane protein insertase
MDAILQPLYDIFGFIVKLIYDTVGNYGVSVILFTILLRAALIPLGVSQFKNTIKQQGMSEEMKDLQRRYGTDKEKMQQAQMELYKKHGFNPLSGCLPSILQMLIIWPVYRIISAPLVHMMGVAKNAIGTVTLTDKVVSDSTGILKILLNNVQDGVVTPLLTVVQAQQAQTFNLPLIDALRNNAAAFKQVVDAGLMKAEQLLDLTFLGLNLGKVPSYDTKLIFGADTMGTYLPLLLIPVIAVVTTWLSMKITQSFMPGAKKKDPDEAARAKNNPAKKGQDAPDPSAGMMKGMQYFLPLFTLMISFTTPAALGLYWIVNNVMSIFQQYLLYKTIGKKQPVAIPATTDASGKPPASKK